MPYSRATREIKTLAVIEQILNPKNCKPIVLPPEMGRLDFSTGELNEEIFKSFSQHLVANSTLKELNIKIFFLKDTYLSLVTLLEKCEGLRKLSLPRCNLDADDIKDLSQHWPASHSLWELDFGEFGVAKNKYSSPAVGYYLGLIIRQCPKLQILKLNNLGFDSSVLADFADACPENNTMTRLDFSRNNLSNGGYILGNILQKLPSLKVLELDECSLVEADFENFIEKSPSEHPLEEIYANENLAYTSSALFGSKFHKLNILSTPFLVRSRIQDVFQMVGFQGSTNSPLSEEDKGYILNSACRSTYLQSLCLDSSFSNREILRELCATTAINEQLAHLNVIGNNLDVEGCGLYLALVLLKFPNLKSLSLDQANITAQFLQELISIPTQLNLTGISNLIDISLMGNELKGSGYELSQLLIIFPRLSSLNLSSSNLTKDDLCSLVESCPDSCNLFNLNLSMNDLKDAGLILVQLLNKLSLLRSLNLYSCKLNLSVFFLISKEATTYQSLLELNLGANELSGDGALVARIFKIFPKLEKLNLNSTGLTNQCLDKFVLNIPFNNLIELSLSGNNFRSTHFYPNLQARILGSIGVTGLSYVAKMIYPPLANFLPATSSELSHLLSQFLAVSICEYVAKKHKGNIQRLADILIKSPSLTSFDCTIERLDPYSIKHLADQILAHYNLISFQLFSVDFNFNSDVQANIFKNRFISELRQRDSLIVSLQHINVPIEFINKIFEFLGTWEIYQQTDPSKMHSSSQSAVLKKSPQKDPISQTSTLTWGVHKIATGILTAFTCCRRKKKPYLSNQPHIPVNTLSLVPQEEKKVSLKAHLD